MEKNEETIEAMTDPRDGDTEARTGIVAEDLAELQDDGDEGGLTPDERKTIIDKLCDLFTMRSAIALIVCVAFCYMTFKGEVGVEDLKTIFMMILTWYFAADQTKKADNG